MKKNTKSHIDRKNPNAHDRWVQDKKARNINKAPKGEMMTCTCGFSSKDKRKINQHCCK